MFDRYVLGPSSMSVTVRSEEKRAPTDESVRLLREMEAAARSKVVEAMRLPNTSVEAIVHRHELDFDLKTMFAIHYAINGKRREVHIAIERAQTIEQCVELLRQRLAEDIADFLIFANAKTIIGPKLR